MDPDQIERIAVEDTNAVSDIRSKGGEVGNLAVAEIEKMRTIAQKTWEEWSKKTPLAKKAYDLQMAWLKALGILA